MGSWSCWPKSGPQRCAKEDESMAAVGVNGPALGDDVPEEDESNDEEGEKSWGRSMDGSCTFLSSCKDEKLLLPTVCVPMSMFWKNSGCGRDVRYMVRLCV